MHNNYAKKKNTKNVIERLNFGLVIITKEGSKTAIIMRKNKINRLFEGQM